MLLDHEKLDFLIRDAQRKSGLSHRQFRRAFRLVQEYFSTGAIQRVPSGIVPDATALEGLIALISNVNNYCEQPYTVLTGQAVANVVTLTASQLMIGGVIIPSLGGITAGFTVQFPVTPQLLAQLGPTIPFDGSYAEPCHYSNSSGQIGTMTVGDANTTISGTATIASGATRKYLVGVGSGQPPTTMTWTNLGSWTYP